MKFNNKMEVGLILVTSILCLILFLKILLKLRTMIPWRVNCWFCNSNLWVKFPERNSWTCPKCEQYNGFTKDGDYNRTLVTANDVMKTPKVFHKSPPKNGLCKMCNINQQLKVAQLANFVPMNERNFDEEIDVYRTQLEKAYKLCSPCKKVLQSKLHKEKELLLGTKLLETRTPDKKTHKHDKQNRAIKDLINSTSMLIATILLALVSYELLKTLMAYKNLPKTITNVTQIIKSLLDRLYSILKMKLLLTFPSIESYIYDSNHNIHLDVDMLPKSFVFFKDLPVNLTMQKALGGFVCLIQILANILNVNTLKNTIIIDLLWSVFVMSLADYIATNALIASLMKVSSALTLMLVYKYMKKSSKSAPRVQSPIKKLKNKANSTLNPFLDDEDTLDTDDDVSLSKFGLHNFSESSNETISPLNNNLMNGRCFTPRSESVWTKPKLNSTFCVNSVMCKSPSSVSDTVFVKPSFNKYQKLAKDDSDSDLDESISSLSLGGPTKAKKKTNSIFSLRKFSAAPKFVTPMPSSCSRPLISPSKLGHSTSWVAGGYWGSENERQNIFNADGSRSSSQSSGFESQTSSMNQRNVFSQPPSREESVCGEPMVLDRFPNMSNLSSYHPAQNFSRMSSPVFPQMQFNNHVHIPQARFAQQPVPQNMFSQNTQYVQSNLFKTPGGSGLIKMSQMNSFTSR